MAWGQHYQCWEATCNAAAFGQSPTPQLDPVSGNGSAPPQTAVLGNSRAAAQDPSHPMGGTGHSTLVCWEASCNRKPARVALGRANGLVHTHPYSTFPTCMGSNHTYQQSHTLGLARCCLQPLYYTLYHSFISSEFSSQKESDNRPMSPVGSVDVK